MNQKKPAYGKLVPVAGPLHNSPMLVVGDFQWWHNNRRELEEWMKDNLPRGLQHLQGMVITFDSEEDRAMFLLRWGM